MYSVQSLWTQARERLPITTIILNNNKYNILIGEYKNVGAVPGDTAMSMLDLGNPKWTDGQLLDFIAEHPVLIQRPIVVTPLGVKICRPSETVLEILPQA